MSQNVKVAVRVRPFNEREKKLNAKSCITMVPSVQQTIIINPEDGKERKFTFDHRCACLSLSRQRFVHVPLPHP